MSVAYAYIEPEPTLFFLFAVEERIQHVNIWGRFFNNPNTTDTLKAFKILVHSRSKNRTREHLIGGYPFRPRNVKRIGSAPHNVHHVHMNLLKSALGNSTHYNDKFMLISHNAVPIKTMKEMRAALFQHSGSDICMLPTHHWIPVQHLNRISYNNSLYNIAVPASHEWMVLNKPDAIRIVKVYPRYSELPSMVQNLTHSPDNPNYYPGNNEETVFVTYLYGTLDKKEPHLFPYTYPYDREQGTCRTFVWRNDYPKDTVFKEPFGSEFTGFPGTKSDGIPKTLSDLSLRNLWKIRDSPNFLIARKFEEGFKVTDKGGGLVPGIEALNMLGIFN